MVFRYLDDLFAGNNRGLLNQLKTVIYKGMIVKQETKQTFLDLNLKIIDGKYITSTYDKRDDYDFDSIKYPHRSSNMSDASKHKIIVGQALRYAKSNTYYKDFLTNTRTTVQHMHTTNQLNLNTLKRNLYKFLDDYPDTTVKYSKPKNTIINDIFKRIKTGGQNMGNEITQVKHAKTRIMDLQEEEEMEDNNR